MSTGTPSERWSQIVGRIYDSALTPELWEHVLSDVQDYLSCSQCFLRRDDLVAHRTQISASVGIDATSRTRHEALAAEIKDILFAVLSSGHSIDQPTVASRVMTPEALRQTRYARDWGVPRGLVDYMGLFLLVTPTRLSALELARHETKGVFGADDIERARQLIPHLRRSMTICGVLDTAILAEARLMETLDALSIGVVLADAESRILHANAAAEAMMQAGTVLVAQSNRLRAGSIRATNEVQSAINISARNEAELGSTGLAVRLTDDTSSPTIAHVLPLANGAIRSRLHDRAVAAVFVSSSRDDAARATAMGRVFGLTHAETRVLQCVLCAQTVNQIADTLGIATSTAKTHLNNISAKTGTRRRMELILLATTIAPVGR